ncbi:MAG: hypothetical protein ETSY1_28950 [Candidatus Entotheonella factor]|uniref:Uncharacterized protein n=1 Tax=Entotheonella factor TaxID=1429438 RepID=W4LCX5_ENTF1|nr:MAG: hypothetical protein ETSY1_28950 [Candidatus Entotheonella factor]
MQTVQTIVIPILMVQLLWAVFPMAQVYMGPKNSAAMCWNGLGVFSCIIPIQLMQRTDHGVKI